MSNKTIGNQFEAEFASMLYANGFWTLNVTQNAAGQASDIVTVRNKRAALIDCKVCSEDRFVLSRAEDNQRLSMEVWEQCGNGNAYFALKVSEGIYMLSYKRLRALEREGKKSINLREIIENTRNISWWVEHYDNLC